MSNILSRRTLLQIGTAALGASAVAGELTSANALATSGASGGSAGKAPEQKKSSFAVPGGGRSQLFYRDDWFGEPWVKPEPMLMIHGVGESSIAWFAWVPRMARQFRVLRPDWPGLGQSPIPPGFEWSLPNLAATLAHFLDSLGADSAHIVGAKLGGAIAMQFAADFPQRTRTLVTCSAPIRTPRFSASAGEFGGKTWVEDTQRDRLGSAAPKEEVDYWNGMMNSMTQETKGGIEKVTSVLNLDSVLPRINSPTLVITSDRSALQPVQTVLDYQKKIKNSRLLVLPTDAYHVAVAKPDECAINVLEFIKETKRA